MAWQAKSGCAEHQDDSRQVDSAIGVNKVGCSPKPKIWKAPRHAYKTHACKRYTPTTYTSMRTLGGRHSYLAAVPAELSAPPASTASLRLAEEVVDLKRKRQHIEKYKISIGDGELDEPQHTKISRRLDGV